MSKVVAIRWISSLPRGVRIGLREQLALLGISAGIVTAAVCAVAPALRESGAT